MVIFVELEEQKVKVSHRNGNSQKWLEDWGTLLVMEEERQKQQDAPPWKGKQLFFCCFVLLTVVGTPEI